MGLEMHDSFAPYYERRTETKVKPSPQRAAARADGRRIDQPERPATEKPHNNAQRADARQTDQRH